MAEDENPKLFQRVRTEHDKTRSELEAEDKGISLEELIKKRQEGEKGRDKQSETWKDLLYWYIN